MEDLVEVIFFYRECEKGENSQAILFNFGNSKYLKEIAIVANGNIIRLENGYFAEKKFMPKEEANKLPPL